MFMPDHLHPNPLGLKAIASEWAARIQTISLRTNFLTSVFIGGGADWKYRDTGEDLGTNWTQVRYDDNSWSHGHARLGYGDSATATVVRFGPEPTNKVLTTYFRRSFVVPQDSVITNLNFRLARTDGAVVWLDGQEMFRLNLPDGPISYTNLALRAVRSYASHTFYPTNLAFTSLPPGTNVIAVEIHQSNPAGSALGFDLELIGSGPLLAPPTLSMTLLTNQMLLSWPETNAATFTLFSSTNLDDARSWTVAPGTPETNAGQIVVTQALESAPRFFRLQR
jgi:hypothetical protein